MKDLTFDRNQFIRIVSIFVLLTCIWTFLDFKYDSFTSNDKGLITGLGYLTIFSASIHFGQNKVSLTQLFHLEIAVLLLYSISSLLFIFVMTQTDSLLLYSLVNSIFASLILTTVLNKLYGIELKKLTVILTAIGISLSYLLFELISKQVYTNLDISPGISIFIFYEFLALIPLAIGLSFRLQPAYNNL